MAYVALYRSWRPQSFDDLVGQEPIKKALTNALESGKISHAYLFAGPRGTGKTSTARILAKALNCDKGPTAHPCNQCAHCREITEGSSADVIEIDAASNRGIEEMKKIREQVYFAPVSSRYKVYIIDEVHMVTADAFNALLKTLEEPPDHVVFILATTEPQKILNTILSRCQRFDFRRVTVDEIAAHLEKVCQGSGIQAETGALRLIAIQADGGMRDALSLLDQCSVMENPVTEQTVRQVLGLVGREKLRQLVLAVGQKNLTAALGCLNQLLEQGREIEQILAELLEYFRALLFYQTDRNYQEIYLTDTAEALEKAAALFSRPQIVAAVERLNRAAQDCRYSPRKKITGEICLFDLCENRGETEAALRAKVAELSEEVAALTDGTMRLHPALVKKEIAADYAVPTVPQEKKAVPLSPQEIFRPEIVPPADARPEISGKQSGKVNDARLLQRIVGKASAVSVPEPRMAAAAPHPDAAASAPSSVLHGGKAEGQQLWNLLCQDLKRENKRAYLIYAEMAHAEAYNGDTLVVATGTSLGKERLEAPEFHGLLVNLLTRRAGRPTALQIIREGDTVLQPVQEKDAVPPKEQKEEKKQKETAESPAAARSSQAADAEKKPPEPELPDSVKKALQVFGGKAYQEE